MATLQIRKKSSKTWLHIPSDADEFILSKFYCKTDDNIFKIVEQSGSSRKEYLYGNITVYDDTAGGAMESFVSSQALMIRLEALKYVGFNRDGDIPTSYVESIVAGTNVTVDNTDPLNPIVNASGGGSATLGLIKIVDKYGEVFTDLATALAYIRNFTSATITNESYSNGTFWFTVPNESSFSDANNFLAPDANTSAYIDDNLGLINDFANDAFYENIGNNILGNCSFGDSSFVNSKGNNILGDCSFGEDSFYFSEGNNTLGNCVFDNSCFQAAKGIYKFKNIYLLNSSDYFAYGASGRFEIYGTIGTTTGNDYANFFPTNTAVIWAKKVMQTNNGGGIEGDLARAQTNGAKLFFGYADGSATLGLIKIVDKYGEVFTDLATASAYIRYFTSATITNESYSNGTFWFTVPNGSSFSDYDNFLRDTTACINDNLGLINTFGAQAFFQNFGNNILGNCTFGPSAFSLSTGNNILGDCTFGNNSFYATEGINKFGNILLSNASNGFGNTTGDKYPRFEIYGNIGTTTANNYINIFATASTVVIWAKKVMQTNNAGGIEGDLARAQTNGAKLFFGYADGGATDLSYTASPTDGTVTSSTGSGATLPLATTTFAGLLSPSEKIEIAKIADINTNAVDRVTVKLNEGVAKGQAVYATGASGTNILVSKASNTTEATSSKTLGLAFITGVTNDVINIVTNGLLDGLDTSSATIGDPVFLGVNGNLIYGTEPASPTHLIFIGFVTRVSATVGEIFIKIQNGYQLAQLHDVLINTPLNNQVLAYDAASGLWKNSNKSVINLVKDSNPTSAVTGTTTQTQIGASILIPANTFSANDVMRLESLAILKTGVAGTCSCRLHINSSNNFATSTVIALTNYIATQLGGSVCRTYEITGGLLKNRAAGTTSGFFDTFGSTTTGLSTSFNPSIDNYLFTSVQLSNATDSVVSTQILITK